MIRVALAELIGGMFGELGPGCLVWNDGGLDDALTNGFDERIGAHCLNEDRAVVMLGRGGDVELHGDSVSGLLPQAPVDVVDGLEPSEFLVVDVVGLVIKDH